MTSNFSRESFSITPYMSAINYVSLNLTRHDVVKQQSSWTMHARGRRARKSRREFSALFLQVRTNWNRYDMRQTCWHLLTSCDIAQLRRYVRQTVRSWATAITSATSASQQTNSPKMQSIFVAFARAHAHLGDPRMMTLARSRYTCFSFVPKKDR